MKFIHEIDSLKEHIGESMIEYSGRKKEAVSLFRDGEKPFMVLTYGTGSKGLNLQFCNRIVFLSQTFDFAQKEHGLHRCYRIGQTQDVEVHDLFVDVGLENIIGKSLQKKTNLGRNIKRLIEQGRGMSL